MTETEATETVKWMRSLFPTLNPDQAAELFLLIQKYPKARTQDAVREYLITNEHVSIPKLVGLIDRMTTDTSQKAIEYKAAVNERHEAEKRIGAQWEEVERRIAVLPDEELNQHAQAILAAVPETCRPYFKRPPRQSAMLMAMIAQRIHAGVSSAPAAAPSEIEKGESSINLGAARDSTGAHP